MILRHVQLSSNAKFFFTFGKDSLQLYRQATVHLDVYTNVKFETYTELNERCTKK